MYIHHAVLAKVPVTAALFPLKAGTPLGIDDGAVAELNDTGAFGIAPESIDAMPLDGSIYVAIAGTVWKSVAEEEYDGTYDDAVLAMPGFTFLPGTPGEVSLEDLSAD